MQLHHKQEEKLWIVKSSEPRVSASTHEHMQSQCEQVFVRASRIWQMSASVRTTSPLGSSYPFVRGADTN